MARQLETDVYKCVGSGDHCPDCRVISQYLLTSRKMATFSTPFHRKPDFTDELFALLSSFTSRLEREEVPSDECHVQLAVITAAFVERARAEYHSTMVISNSVFHSARHLR